MDKRTWNRDPGQRWEEGIPHHPESVKLYKEIAEMDYKYCNDSFCFTSGGGWRQWRNSHVSFRYDFRKTRSR